MQTNPKRPSPAGLTGYVSEHQFGLMMLSCALTLAVMLAVVYGTLGFVPIWAVHAVPAS
ncbi:hypothetical protein KPL78_15575 [Roseomonas sp. HJA6]|uniref:Uncharacterized protein n=1 Tax=Roseomonas alba TaxID=2846776 RepID=A0ABS7AAG5_9PROT|nr:hypothetical protein [Neoroseomonas alba]MBW6399281.1 hypothetical protein [Neoroseomonas alba]